MKTKNQNQTVAWCTPSDEPALASNSENGAWLPLRGQPGGDLHFMKLWVVFFISVIALAARAQTIQVDSLFGSYIVNTAGLAQGPNGSFAAGGPQDSNYPKVFVYTPTHVYPYYNRQILVLDSCGGFISGLFEVQVTANPDGTFTARTSTGAKGAGITAKFSGNGATVLCCNTNPANAGATAGDVASSEYDGEDVDWMDQVSGSGSNQTVEMVVWDETPCPPGQIVDPPLPAGDYNPNGLALFQGGPAPGSLAGFVLYGTTEYGGTYGAGILYSINGDGTGFQVLHNFGSGPNDGQYPMGNVIFSPDGSTLYGTASGPNNGVIYAVSTNGTGYTNLVVFGNVNGGARSPAGDLLLVGNTFYGVATNGGTFMPSDYLTESAAGVLFSVNTNGTGFKVLYTFVPLSAAATNSAGLRTNTIGAYPVGGLILSSNNLVGATSAGGTNGYGTIFALPLVAPVITNPPANQALDYGDPVIFTVGVDGAGPFYYQWQLNGTNLTGPYATNNPYVIPDGGFGSTNLGGYSVIITNAYGSVTSSVATLSQDILQNDSFESASLTGWTVSSDANASAVIAYYREPYIEGTAISYSGFWGASLKNSTLNQMDSISQAAPTIAGQSYLLSFWLNTSMLSSGYSNVFFVSWNGSVVFSQTNIPTGTNSLFGSGDPVNGWTNVQCIVAAPGTNAVLAFGFQTGNSGDAFILDAVSLAPRLPQFTATPSVGSPPLAVQFAAPLTDTNGNAFVGWDWIFGDGSTSMAQAPSHTFNTSGIYAPTLTATNSNGLAVAVPGPFIDVAFIPPLLNGGFETGSLPPWTVSGDPFIFVFEDFYPYYHSGNYSVVAYPQNSPGYLSQNCVTTSGTQYLLSFWLYCDGAAPNQFLASWNGTNLVNLTNVPYVDWTNFQYTVTATASSTVLEFGFLKDGGYFGFDDVSVTPLLPPSPIPLNLQLSGNQLILNWTNPAFSLQTAPTVTGAWVNVPVSGPPYTNATTNRQSFFRLAH